MTDHETYYATALSWADERVVAERRMRRFAWIVAGVAGAIALILAIAMLLLVPLKSVQPYVVTVDRQVDRPVAARLIGPNIDKVLGLFIRGDQFTDGHLRQGVDGGWLGGAGRWRRVAGVVGHCRVLLERSG